MAELRSLLKPNEAVKLYAVSVDSPEESHRFAEKIASDGRGEVAFAPLSDPESKTIDTYGLRDLAYAGQEKEGIPHPAIYVIGKEGRVESDYRKRPTNDEIRAALAALKE